MIELATLARPYSEAVFKRAKETRSTDEWSDMLAFLSQVMDDERLALVAGNPRIERHGFTELLLGICEGHLNNEGKNFAQLLIENDRLGLISHIRRLFEELKAEDEGYMEVDVNTAYPLSDGDKRRLAESLERKFKKKVKFHAQVDSALIGGALIRAGDKVIDGSVRGQVHKLSQILGA